MCNLLNFEQRPLKIYKLNTHIKKRPRDMKSLEAAKVLCVKRANGPMQWQVAEGCGQASCPAYNQLTHSAASNA